MNKIMKKTIYYDKDFEYHFEPIEDTIKIKKTKKGFTVKYLIQDDYPENPLENWDGYGRFYHWKDRRKEEYSRYCELLGYDEDTREIIGKDNPLTVRIDKYEHSCIYYSIAGEGNQCRWDTSYNWAVWYPDDCLLEELNEIKNKKKQRKRVIELAKQACELFNQWANGDVYCLVREDYNKKKESIDYDVVGGYYGYENACKALDSEI